MSFTIYELKQYLEGRIKELQGTWITKNSGYEQAACDNLGFTCQTKRYWDCIFNGLYIEIKKGKSIWLDEIRYAELLLSQSVNTYNNTSNDTQNTVDISTTFREEIVVIPDDDKCKKTITMFLIPNKDKTRICKIYIIDTCKLITFMNITHEWATLLLSRHKQITRSLNCQQSMTLKDLSMIADYIIE